MINCKKVCLYF